MSLANGWKILFALLLAAATFGVVSAVQAAIPDSNGVIHGCVLPSGSLRVIDSAAATCGRNEASLDWNQAGAAGPAGKDGVPGTDGAPGKDGVSPTVTQLASGDSHCAAGGAAITDASGNTAYVCSGATGASGASFDGTYTSPNGEFGISVTDSGIKLTGPTGKVTVDGSSVSIESLSGTKLGVGFDSIDMQTVGGTSLDLATGLDASAAGPLSLSAIAPLTLSSQAPSSFSAPLLSLGGTACGHGAARIGDSVVANPAGTIVSGSAKVDIC